MAALLFAIEQEEEDEANRVRHRIFRDRLNPLDSLTDEELITTYRLNRAAILHLCDELNDELKWPSNKSGALPVELQILTALRFYATGSFQNVIGDTHGIHRSSVSRIISRVSNALSGVINNYVYLPNDENGFRLLKQGFYERGRFPNVLGAVDGTLIPIKKPSTDEHLFVSRKGFHAINMQGVSDANMKFLSVTIKFPGSTHDSYVWNNSAVARKFEQGELGNAWLLGDSG
jgi:hypothetical protein